MIDPAFWKGRSVFVTGHTGFKGSWLTLWLQSLGARVTGFSLEPPSRPSLFEEAKVAEGITSVHGDIRNLDALTQALQQSRADVVLHLAAQSLVRRSYADPVETFGTNVLGTVHMLEAVRRVDFVRAVVIVTTDKCYENREWLWPYRESDSLGGRDPYSNSKACAELVTQAYRDSFFNVQQHARHGVGIASARAGNVIGGGDWASDRLVPDLIAGFAGSKPVRIRNPHAVRPWQHVLEPVSGYMMLAERLHRDGAAFSEAWNFGPDDQDARTVGWVADFLVREWGPGARWERDGDSHPHEAGMLRLDHSKARTRLGWAPRWDVAEALRSTVAWHRLHLERPDPSTLRAAVLESVRRYLSSGTPATPKQTASPA